MAERLVNKWREVADLMMMNVEYMTEGEMCERVKEEVRRMTERDRERADEL